MSTLTQPGLFKSTSCDAGLGSRHVAGHGISVLVRDAWHRLQAWRSEQRAIRDLHRLNDYELRDIGITRGEIEAAARGELSRGRRRS